MSEKESKVRLELAAGGFLSMLQEVAKQSKHLAEGLEGIGESGEKADKKLSPMLASLKKGAGAAKDSLAELGSSLKSTLASAATLGGALSFGAGAHAGMALVSTYKDLAFQISTGTGKAVEWTEVQKDIEGAASRWKQSNEKVAASYRALFDETGDLQFTADAVDAVAMAATASGKSLESLTSIAGTLNEKFGIAGDEMEDALASVLELSSKGGATVEDLGAKLGVVGASAKQMGLEGKAGLQQVLGMLNVGDNVTGSFKKNLAAVTGLMETFGNADKLKSIEKDLGIKLTDKGGGARKDALDKILSKTGGKEETLSKVFQGDTLKLVSDFGKTFQKTFSETEGTAKQKTAAALAAFHHALDEAGKTTLTASQLEAQAKKRAAEDPERAMDDAMNKFKAAFTKPEMMASMEKLAQLLPRMASGAAKLVEMVANHPLLAGAAFVGAKAGGSFATSIAGDAIKGIGKSIGKDIATAAAKDGAWAVAGKGIGAAAGIAVAAAVAYELGKAAIDSVYETKAADQGDLAAGGANAIAAIASGDKSRMRDEIVNLNQKIKQAEDNQSGVGGFVDKAFGKGAAWVTGDDSIANVQDKAIAGAKADLEKLEKALNRGGKATDKAADSHDKVARAAERAAAALDRIVPPGGGGGGTNGLPPAPGNGSGSAPGGRNWFG